MFWVWARDGRALMRICLSMLRPQWEALNQFRPSVLLWSETLWPTFVTHVGILAQLILQIFTSYSYDEFGQLEKSINYTLSSGELNGLYKKSPRLPVPDINFRPLIVVHPPIDTRTPPTKQAQILPFRVRISRVYARKCRVQVSRVTQINTLHLPYFPHTYHGSQPASVEAVRLRKPCP